MTLGSLLKHRPGVIRIVSESRARTAHVGVALWGRVCDDACGTEPNAFRSGRGARATRAVGGAGAQGAGRRAEGPAGVVSVKLRTLQKRLSQGRFLSLLRLNPEGEASAATWAGAAHAAAFVCSVVVSVSPGSRSWLMSRCIRDPRGVPDTCRCCLP